MLTHVKEIVPAFLHRLRWSRTASSKVLFGDADWTVTRDQQVGLGLIEISHRRSKTYTHVSDNDLVVKIILPQDAYEHSDGRAVQDPGLKKQYEQMVQRILPT